MEIYSHRFLKKFRESTILLVEIFSLQQFYVKSIWISTKIYVKSTFSLVRGKIIAKFYVKPFSKQVSTSQYHSVEIKEILSHTFFAKISWNQWFYLRNHWIVDESFFQWERISIISTVWVWKGNYRIFLSHFFGKNFVKITILHF